MRLKSKLAFRSRRMTIMRANKLCLSSRSAGLLWFFPVSYGQLLERRKNGTDQEIWKEKLIPGWPQDEK